MTHKGEGEKVPPEGESSGSAASSGIGMGTMTIKKREILKEVQAVANDNHNDDDNDGDNEGGMDETSLEILSACLRGVDVTDVFSPERINQVCHEYRLTVGTSVDMRNG